MSKLSLNHWLLQRRRNTLGFGDFPYNFHFYTRPEDTRSFASQLDSGSKSSNFHRHVCCLQSTNRLRQQKGFPESRHFCTCTVLSDRLRVICAKLCYCFSSVVNGATNWKHYNRFNSIVMRWTMAPIPRDRSASVLRGHRVVLRLSVLVVGVVLGTN